MDEAVAGAARHGGAELMITGVHAIIFTKDANGVRALFRDVLEFPSVDAGEGWLIFALPPAELAARAARMLRAPGRERLSRSRRSAATGNRRILQSV